MIEIVKAAQVWWEAVEGGTKKIKALKVQNSAEHRTRAIQYLDLHVSSTASEY